MPERSFVGNLSDLFPPDALRLLSANGKNLVSEIGIEVVRGVILDVLTGRNMRDSTEFLTRRRIAALNIATLSMFLTGASQYPDFIEQLPSIATRILTRKRLSKSEKWLAQWVLGLTDKAFQNVLRDDTDALSYYREQYIRVCAEVLRDTQKIQGELRGELSLGPDVKANVNLLFMVYLLTTIGAQTLAIRGSEKSAYGKLFEKLILGSLLSIFGFRQISPTTDEILDVHRVFWLSSRGDKRESDATLLYEMGKGVRFDIGFIGRGNPEISLDKVSRFEREITLGRAQWYMGTIILVDRIGKNSRIERLAADIDGTIIQMSASLWPQRVAQELNRAVGFRHPLVNMHHTEIQQYIESKLQEINLMQFIEI